MVSEQLKILAIGIMVKLLPIHRGPLQTARPAVSCLESITLPGVAWQFIMPKELNAEPKCNRQSKKVVAIAWPYCTVLLILLAPSMSSIAISHWYNIGLFTKLENSWQDMRHTTENEVMYWVFQFSLTLWCKYYHSMNQHSCVFFYRRRERVASPHTTLISTGRVDAHLPIDATVTSSLTAALTTTSSGQAHSRYWVLHTPTWMRLLHLLQDIIRQHRVCLMWKQRSRRLSSLLEFEKQLDKLTLFCFAS